MSLKVVIPTPLRKHTSGAEIVELEAASVQEVIEKLEERFPGIRASICDDSGSLRRLIAVLMSNLHCRRQFSRFR